MDARLSWKLQKIIPWMIIVGVFDIALNVAVKLGRIEVPWGTTAFLQNTGVTAGGVLLLAYSWWVLRKTYGRPPR